jgi:hypothetical protein
MEGGEMFKLFSVAAVAATISTAANAQYVYYPNTFQGNFAYGYNMATQGYMNGAIASQMAMQRRANEAMINEMRRARGAPPCDLGFPGLIPLMTRGSRPQCD